jgi:two-component system response regulator DevR
VEVATYALAVVEHADRPDTIMEAVVVDGNARRQSQSFGKGFILVGEVIRTHLVGEVEVAEHLALRPEGHPEEGLHWWMMRREPVAVVMRSKVSQAERLGVGDHESEHAPSRGPRSDGSLFHLGQPDGQELLEARSSLVEHSEGTVAGADQGAGFFNQMTQQDRELDIGFDHEHGIHQATQLLRVVDVAERHDPDRIEGHPWEITGTIRGCDSGDGPYWHNGYMAIRVFLLDDHEVVREGIRLLLESDDDIEVVGEASTAAEAMDRIPVAKPDVAILDVRLDGAGGIEVCRDARSLMPELICLMLTSFADDEALFASVMAGAAGYVLKQIKARDLIDDVHRVAAGESLLDPRTVARVVERISNPPKTGAEFKGLTPQEQRILDLIAEGLTNRQIADSMFLAEHTVKNYITGLLRKLEMSSRTEAAIYATKLKAGDNKPEATNP